MRGRDQGSSTVFSKEKEVEERAALLSFASLSSPFPSFPLFPSSFLSYSPYYPYPPQGGRSGNHSCRRPRDGTRSTTLATSRRSSRTCRQLEGPYSRRGRQQQQVGAASRPLLLPGRRINLCDCALRAWLRPRYAL